MFRHLHASFSQKRNDDNLFPFNRYANRMVDRHQFEPPSLGLRRMFFRTREDVAPTNFAPGTVGPPDYPALLTNRLTTFQDIGRSDMAFFCGFSEVVPEGMHTKNINYDPREYKQPPLHRLPYSHKNFPPRDIHRECQEANDDALLGDDADDFAVNPNRPFDTSYFQSEHVARTLVNAATEQYLCSHGHPEEWHCRALHNCNGIPGNREPVASALHLSQAFHQPICSTNKHVNVHIRHLNLNDKSLDNDVEMEHRYFFCYTLFLDASTHLYKRLCPSVGPSVGRSVRR